MTRPNGNEEKPKTEEELRAEAEKAVTQGNIDWNEDDD